MDRDGGTDRWFDPEWLASPERTVRDAILGPLRRTPLEILVAVAAAVVGSLTIADLLPAGYEGSIFADWLLTTLPLFVALVAVSSLRFLGVVGERTRWILSGAYVVGAVLYGSLLLGAHPAGSGPSTPELYRWVLLTTALGLGLFLIPLAVREGPGRTRAMIGQFAVRLLRRAVVAGIFGVALYAGVSGAITAITSLFDVSIDPEIFGHLGLWLVGVVGVWTFVAELPSMADRELEDPGPLQTRLLTGAGNWLFLPLSGLYLAILYVYELRVVWTGEAPKNLLSPLALGAAILVVVGVFLFDYLRRTDRGRSLVDRLEWLPVAYAPVIPMPIWAIGVRIHQHGWTEFRYVRMLAAVGVAAAFGYATVAKLRGSSPKVQAFPATFAICALLGVAGPWSVVDLPEASQRAHLRAELDDAGALEEGRVRDLSREQAGNLRPQLVRNIQSRARYLESHYGRSSLEGVAKSELEGEASNPVAALGLSSLANVEPAGTDSVVRKGSRHDHVDSTTLRVDFSEGWKLEDAPRVAELHEVEYHELDDGSSTVRFDRDDGPTLTADLTPIVEELERRAPVETDWVEDLPSSLATVPLVDDTGRRRGTLVLDSVELQRRPGRTFDPQACRGWGLLHHEASTESNE